MAVQALINPETQIKVSSTLDKSVGKKHLVDGSPETCWTSQQGLPQYIQLTFPSPVRPTKIHLTFQGGFVGTQCSIKVGSEGQDLKTIYPEDVNREQVFDLETEGSTAWTVVKLVFDQSSDFFGRITIYDVQIHGFID